MGQSVNAILEGDDHVRFPRNAEAARQLLVGRVLTVQRVRELNAKDCFYQMLKDNPAKLMWPD
jgi:hypothetical protein